MRVAWAIVLRFSTRHSDDRPPSREQLGRDLRADARAGSGDYCELRVVERRLCWHVVLILSRTMAVGNESEQIAALPNGRGSDAPHDATAVDGENAGVR